MQVRLEVEFDDTEFSITQRDSLGESTHSCHHASRICSCAAVGTMGQCVGRMLVALMNGSSAPLDVILEEFNAVVARSARNPGGYSPPVART